MSNRIKVSLSEEAAEVLIRYAEANSISKSRAANELILSNLRRPSQGTPEDGVPILDIPSKAKKLR